MPVWSSKWSRSVLWQATSSTYKPVWKTQQCSLPDFGILQGVASNIYPSESLGDFTQTLFLQGKTSQSTFRCKLALFLYCLLDRQSGAGGHKLKLESFRCTNLCMCAPFLSMRYLPGNQTTANNTTDLHLNQHRGPSLYQLYHDYI